ncbi:hypothetical protein CHINAEXTREME_04870 [Halobiforma lacisalsi AJ5]|uniref:DUF1616 domain-containing protein n=1 Tax=Natronobacterium lacisalsi AJ5 TaxID=358396 RepID=M0LQZ6_NATLA|nr:DUF1616 domain-containing protein [Halobiforma lacisalsi]APW97141.1 hypothetical protein CHINAEXTREME_04870 [Halobiforma lacisalsi AJ5]EMA34480.1 hypothetical protein C445_08137 [Halobiforma lacisalsi AJ5]
MSDTDWWFFDLALVVAAVGGLTLAVVAGAGGVARILLTIPLVCFLPGYALVSAMFPDGPTDDYQAFDEGKTGLGNPLLVSGGLEGVERTVLSIVFSVALVPAVALFASATPGGLIADQVLLGISALTAGLAVIAILSRYRCEPERRFTPSLSSASPFFDSRSSFYERRNVGPYNAAIAVGLVLVVLSAGFALASPPQHDGFTEFSIETEAVTGETDTMYDSTYEIDSQPQELEATITNHEREERTYTTVVALEQVSYGDGGVTVHERDELDRQRTTVPDGESARQTLEIDPTMSGDDLRLRLLLYEGEPPADPTPEEAYRVVTLPIEVE